MDKKETKFKKEIKSWIKSIIHAIVIAVIIKIFFLQTVIVIGVSMNPTLNENDRLLVNKAIYLVKEPKRGDIVTINAPDKQGKIYIKRVIGLENETLEIKNGKIYINGEILKEPYLQGNINTNSKYKSKWRIPKNYVFVIGDNRQNSNDSRNFGPVKIKRIQGKAFFRFFPFGKRFGQVK
ncbi:signal peptidase I [Caloranaerobacter ferrireducens]|uniref:signal peptidase I n=1 Tax=Caloranaerobacter ferrireducens TaxID=1323370 RepID=UPI00084DF16E|nr:signal peptidase I [Caloranaerobacter ferrireducens]